MNKLIFAVLAAALAAPALAQNIAIVNGKPVPLARMEALIEQVVRSGQQLTPELMQELREAVIDREILVQEARRLGLEATPQFRAQWEFARDSLLIRDLVVHYQQNHPVTDAEIQVEYDKFAADNAGQEYRASHILVSDETQAKNLITQLQKGAKFGDLAMKHSRDPGSGSNGGDLDWASADSYVPEFAEALKAMRKGQFSANPVRTQFGWHVIYLADTREAKLPTLEELKPQIAQQLGQNKLMQLQEELRNKAKVE